MAELIQMLLIFKLEPSYQVLGREQLDMYSRSINSLPAQGRGRGFITSLVTVNIGLLSISHEMRDIRTRCLLSEDFQLVMKTDTSIAVYMLMFSTYLETIFTNFLVA